MRTLLAEPAPPDWKEVKSIKPRLGFLGVGWIGRNRLEAIAASGLAEIAAIADTSAQSCRDLQASQPGAAIAGSFEELMEAGLDGVVIATPSALHAEQSVAALERGLAVFCQKPLGRDAAETSRVIAAARAADRLLGVDLSYRFITAARKVHELCRGGQLGEIFAVDLVFHNAYGPDKPWFYDRRLSGGGCVLDLGIHLVDLALWNLGFPEVTGVSGRLFSRGGPLSPNGNNVEDYAVARLDTATGAAIQLACSWNLPAGRDAVISAAFYGTRGGAVFRNVNGSFYEFVAERHVGTRSEVVCIGPDSWGGRAALDWVKRLSGGGRFSPDVENLQQVAQCLGCIYEHSAR